MLSDITKLLNERGPLSIQEIAYALKIESEALRPMLEMLERKRKILKVKLPCKAACAGGCTESDNMTIYKTV